MKQKEEKNLESERVMEQKKDQGFESHEAVKSQVSKEFMWETEDWMR